MEPLKMQGVDQVRRLRDRDPLEDHDPPGEQFVIRRKAFAMIKKAFDANGIKFAFPTVQIAGGEATPAVVAAAQRMLLVGKEPAVEDATAA